MPERDSITLTTVLVAFASNGSLREAVHIFQATPWRNLASWNSMLDAYAKAGEDSNVANTFEKMPERDLLSWNIMLSSCSQNIQDAEHIFAQMPQRDLVSYGAMLFVYGQRGNLRDAKRIFTSEMPFHNLVSCTAMLNAYAQEGHLQQAKDILQDMPEWDLVLVSAMMVAYSRHGDINAARFLFDTSYVRDVVCWTAMLRAYAFKGHLEESKHLFDWMPEHDTYTWNAMLSAYSQNWHLEEAKDVFETMPEHNSVSWNTMLSVYSLHKRPKLAQNFFDAVPEHNLVTWGALLAAYAQNGHYEEAFFVFHTAAMVHELDLACFVMFFLACSHSGKVGVGKQRFASISIDYGLTPNKQHYSCMLDILSRAGHLDDARDLLANMPFAPNSLERYLSGFSRDDVDVEVFEDSPQMDDGHENDQWSEITGRLEGVPPRLGPGMPASNQKPLPGPNLHVSFLGVVHGDAFHNLEYLAWKNLMSEVAFEPIHSKEEQNLSPLLRPVGHPDIYY
ncbi:pentatricopeptide repeat-containing protein At4g02750-like [Selaginella moellendorffii]|uniref:pentatricopeptide repeat-containing protein At4g02750-like n=1 Tax=Selaginella moellendorffii TaxID=88036 RepID=UPI000D1CDF68|nr:pentatricopeptide repeat-containing protein At4g02750-like [Selaginella moellendorffii]|eukprot:XP_024533897.1 pentatricopeptide repeat-containing protein At4g02750-like [Selaginella moellendorffii]